MSNQPDDNESWGAKSDEFFKPSVDSGIEYDRASGYFWETREKYLKKMKDENGSSEDIFSVSNHTKYW